MNGTQEQIKHQAIVLIQNVVRHIGIKKERGNKMIKRKRIFSESHRKKLSEATKGKTLEEIVGIKRAKEIKKKQSNSHKGKIPWNKGKKNVYSDESIIKMSKVKKGIKHTSEHKANLSKARIGMVFTDKHKNNISNSHKGMIHSEETKLKMSISHKKQFEDEEFVKKYNATHQRKPNKTEKILIKMFKNYNLDYDYVGNNKFWVSRYNPDFKHKYNKILIEMFGDYYHSIKDSKERDKIRINSFIKKGYRVLIIWEHTIKKLNKYGRKLTDEEVISIILDFENSSENFRNCT